MREGGFQGRRRRLDDCEMRGSPHYPRSFKKSPSSGIGGLKKSRVDSEGVDGIEALRLKLMFQMAVDKVRLV